MSTRSPLQRAETHVTRERVIAPPDRFIFGVQDEELITYFSDVFGSELAPALPVLHQLIEGICTADFTSLRRRLQADYEYFGAAAEERSDVPLRPAEELEQQELRFLLNFTQLMAASQYRLLSRAEWEAAQAEDFLFTLPCDVKWSAMDNQLLPRYWAVGQEERSLVPEEIADRILVFHRGTEVATMQGSYFLLKLNLLISMWLLQPIYAFFVAIMAKLGVRRFVPDAPKGLARSEEEDPASRAALERAAKADLHPASSSIERRTFARVFPDGSSVLKKMVKTVKLQEACFRDVVILYRRAVPDKPIPVSEVEVIKEADPKFMQRNIQLRQFRGVPMADLEMVMPEKKIFVPPKVFVEMAVTIIGGIAAVASAFLNASKDHGVDMRTVYTATSLLGGRAFQVYCSALYQKISIENAMGKLLYERTVGSGESVLTSLVDGVCRQRVREILLCYCVLLDSQKPLAPQELDERCERLLASQFGCKIDFCCEEALHAVEQWGLAHRDGAGALTAVPLPDALRTLDEVWDAIHDFKGSAKAVLAKAARRTRGDVTEFSSSSSSASSSPSPGLKPTAPMQTPDVATAAARAGGAGGREVAAQRVTASLQGAALGRSLSGQARQAPKRRGVRRVLHKLGQAFAGAH